MKRVHISVARSPGADKSLKVWCMNKDCESLHKQVPGTFSLAFLGPLSRGHNLLHFGDAQPFVPASGLPGGSQGKEIK